MKTLTLLALASGLYIQASHAAVQFSFAKQKIGGHEDVLGSTRRSDTIKPSLAYRDATYVVDVTVGTPGQPVSLQLSPSASNTFVIDRRSDWCTVSYYYSSYDDEDIDDSDTNESEYCPWGTFSPGNSTSYKSLSTTSDEDGYSSDSDFYETYDSGNYVYGEYMNDVLTIDGMTVSNLTMGLVNDTSSLTLTYMGVLGIGYNDSEYDNLPNRLQQDGLINSTAYSIWVDDKAASSGNLLFGAIDTTKFEGNLTRLMSQFSYYKMMVQVVGINGSTTKSDGPVAITSSSDEDSASGYSTSETDGDSFLFSAVFSPSDTVSNLPTDIASQVWQMAGAYYDDSVGMALVSCSAADDATNFTIQLGGQGSKGPIISAFMSDLVIPADEFNMSSYYSYYYKGTENMCLFGVQNSSSVSYYSSSSYNLGSTLLRRTYSVFDLVNNEVAVAPVKFDATSTSNIVPFESYGASVPSSTILCVYSDCYADSGSGSGTNSDNSLGQEIGGTRRLTGVLPVGALVGMSLGIALGCLALGLAGILIWRHRRNRSPSAKEVASVSSAEAGGGAPIMSSATAAGDAAPEMEEPPQAPAAGVGKGKAPEVREPVPGSSMSEPRATSRAAEAENIRHADHGEASSSRNV